MKVFLYERGLSLEIPPRWTWNAGVGFVNRAASRYFLAANGPLTDLPVDYDGLGRPVEYGTPTPSVTEMPVVVLLPLSSSKRIPAASTVWRMKYWAGA